MEETGTPRVSAVADFIDDSARQLSSKGAFLSKAQSFMSIEGALVMERSNGQGLARERAASAMDLLLSRIKGEFREMPGLNLTLAQAQRLWHLDETTCRLVLSELVAHDFLRKNARGCYFKA